MSHSQTLDHKCGGGSGQKAEVLVKTNGAIWRHETFSFMMSHPAMSLGDSLCVSRKGGAGGSGWVHPKGANSMATSGLSFEQTDEAFPWCTLLRMPEDRLHVGQMKPSPGVPFSGCQRTD